MLISVIQVVAPDGNGRLGQSPCTSRPLDIHDYQQLRYDHELQSDVKADAPRASNAVGYSFLLSVSP